ncbi:hypothetical protein [Rhodococcus koreensis]
MEVFVGSGGMEAGVAGVFGLELPGLEFDRHDPGLGPVEDQQVDVGVVVVGGEVVLPADEGEAVTEIEPVGVDRPTGRLSGFG